MSRERKQTYDIKSQKRKDDVTTIILSLASLCPTIGNGLATGIGNYLTVKHIRNLENIVNTTLQALAPFDNCEDIKEYILSDEYIQLFLSTLQKAQIEHHERKRKNFGYLLANLALDRETPYDQKALFCNLLSELEEPHIRTLDYLNRRSQGSDEDRRWTQLKEVRSSVSNLDKASAYYTVSVLNKLADSGMIKSKGSSDKVMMGTNPVGLWFNSWFTITDLGQKLLEYLKEQ